MLRVSTSVSSSSRNETGKPGVDDTIETTAGVDGIELRHRVIGDLRHVEVLANAVGRLRRGQQGSSPLHRPGEQHLRGRLSGAPGDANDDRIVEEPRLEAVAERREGEQYDAMLPAIL